MDSESIYRHSIVLSALTPARIAKTAYMLQREFLIVIVDRPLVILTFMPVGTSPPCDGCSIQYRI